VDHGVSYFRTHCWWVRALPVLAGGPSLPEIVREKGRETVVEFAGDALAA
jgi:hypothetical protein